MKTMGRPRRSAEAITSGSFTEPQGWITAVPPAFGGSRRRRGRGRERVRGYDAALQRLLRFHPGQFYGVHAAHLQADAERGAIFAKTMAWDFYVFAISRRKRRVLIPRRWDELVTGAQFRVFDFTIARTANQDATRCAFVKFPFRLQSSGGNSSKRDFLGAEDGFGFSSKPGAACTRRKSLATFFGGAASLCG